MFWNRRQRKLPKLSEPKTLPQELVDFLLVEKKADLGVLMDLKVVYCQWKGDKRVHNVRIYNGKQVTSLGIIVHNYESLDQYPELVLFEGWWDKEGSIIYLKSISRELQQAGYLSDS